MVKKRGESDRLGGTYTYQHYHGSDAWPRQWGWCTRYRGTNHLVIRPVAEKIGIEALHMHFRMKNLQTVHRSSFSIIFVVLQPVSVDPFDSLHCGLPQIHMLLLPHQIIRHTRSNDQIHRNADDQKCCHQPRPRSFILYKVDSHDWFDARYGWPH